MRPDPLVPLLASGPIVIDGGLATQLEAAGHDLSDELWSARLLLADPAAIRDAHLAYFRAGARVATTASYQATFEGFARRGLDRPAAERLLRLSVELAIDAREGHVAAAAAVTPELPPARLLVAASVGPYGAMLADGSEYRGRYGLDVPALRDFHRARLGVLAAAGPDLLACETIPELEEAVALGELLDEHPDAVAWISFTCADGARLRSGAPFEEAVMAAVASPRVVAIGVNCTSPEHVDELLARGRSVTDRPFVVYPNSGEGWDAVARGWTPPAPGAIDVDGTAARRWLAAGASLIGGCCRVGPDRIALVAGALAG